MKTTSIALSLCFALLACSGADDPAGPDGALPDLDLASVFLPPTAAEIAAVEEDWAARSPIAADVRTEREASLTGPTGTTRFRVVSHVVDNARHYGAILSPDGAPAESLPVLVYLHGGDQGTDVSELLFIAGIADLQVDEFVFVQPSFRGESLRALDGEWFSQGAPSPWDRDVDDALALLDVTISTIPSADPDRIMVFGQSRGGGVALLMGIRDSRIRGVLEFFGPTDFFDPWIRGIMEDVIRGNNRPLPGLETLASQWIRPFAQGTVTPAEVRRQLLLRSPVYFVDRLPRTQIHHGSADDVVSVTQAQRLITAAANRSPTDLEAFIYPGGGHNPLTLPGSIDRATRFLQAIAAGPVLR